MAISSDSLEGKIISNLKGAGFVLEGTHAKTKEFAQAIAKAVVEEITKNAQVIVGSGSSAGTYKVK